MIALSERVRTIAPHWDALRAVGNSWLVRASAIMPFIGYLILFNENVAQILGSFHLEPPPSGSSGRFSAFVSTLHGVRLHFLFFGLFILGLGSTAYQVSCPALIRKYGRATEYIAEERGTFALATLRRAARDRDILYPANIHEDDEKAIIMRGLYVSEADIKPVSRLFAGIFFVAGLGILAIPSVTTALLVAQSLGVRLSAD
jgi:hypothetical protein